MTSSTPDTNTPASTENNKPNLEELPELEAVYPGSRGLSFLPQQRIHGAKRLFCYSVVWLWNVLFAIVMLFGFLPFVFAGLVQSTLSGVTPWDFTLLLMGTLIFPFFCIGMMWHFFYGMPSRQLIFFYGIQAPVFTFLLLRVGLLQETSAGVWFLMLSAGVGLVSFGIGLRRPDEADAQQAGLIEQNTPMSQVLPSLELAAHTLLLITGLYFSLLLLFYAVPIGWFMLGTLLKFEWLVQLLRAPLHLLLYQAFFSIFFVTPLLLFSATLFVGMPVAMGWLYSKAWWRAWQRLRRVQSGGLAASLTGGVLLVWVVCFSSLSQQHQVQAFEMVQTPPKSRKERQRHIDNANIIHKGLLNAYLSSYRYIGSTKGKHISVMYKEVFHLPEDMCKHIQDAFSAAAAPFVYKGERFYLAHRKAEHAYKKFFDQDPQRAARSEVLHAVGSSINTRISEAKVLSINSQEVKLVSQDLSLKEHGAWADVELHEVYQNQTFLPQEIYYYFSMPEGAVVTGLWLSQDGAPKKAFRYVVAPRGAAKRVYRRQIAKRVDPALLEQVGPRQYRLRAFPIPAKPRRHTPQAGQPATHFHLWMSFKVLRHKDAWPMPRLTQKRRVYWDTSTSFSRKGEKQQRSHRGWLPKQLRAASSFQPRRHRLRLADQYEITATPITKEAQQKLKPQKMHFALVLDRSYSMTSHRKEVSAVFQWLKTHITPRNKVSLFLTSSKWRGAAPRWLPSIQKFQPDTVVYYGGDSLAHMMKQFRAKQGKRRFDAVIMLTDAHSDDLAKSRKKHLEIGAPLWLLHVGGRVAHAYEDSILATIQHGGGGVGTDPATLFQRIEARRRYSSKGIYADIAGGYLWHIKDDPSQRQSKTNAPKKLRETGMEAIAARKLIQAMIQAKAIGKLGVLDTLHRLAKRYSVVSPYSSMIVLVNQAQLEELRRESKRKDRFHRGDENNNTPLNVKNSPLEVTGTPEPHEWLLIFLVVLALVLTRHRAQRA